MEITLAFANIPTKDLLETNLKERPGLSAYDLIHIRALLPINISATVLRESDSRGYTERIKIQSGEKERIVTRATGDSEEGLSVSCDHEGDIVPVKTFNLEFRDYKDAFTDRGLVWVIPGNPAQMTLTIKKHAISEWIAGQIMEEATKAVYDQLLNTLEPTPIS